MATGNISIVLEGRGELTLRPSDHVATGGEGSAYKASNTAIKLYTDKRKMVNESIDEKIQILSKLQHDYIVFPSGIVFSKKNVPIGFYMPYVSGEPLSRIFTNSFWERAQFNAVKASLLSDRIFQAFQYAHKHGAVLVDANELNWIVCDSLKEPIPKAIDVDSWAIGRWPASVVMPSIRDWHSKDFNSATDWFSWGILTFQIYTGIHPFKGRLDGYAPNDLKRRMEDNASVFSKNIRLNKAVRDFSSIPKKLLEWYTAEFQKGYRTDPPSPMDGSVSIPRISSKTMTIQANSSGVLVINKILDVSGDDLIKVFPCGVALSSSGNLYDVKSRRKVTAHVPLDAEVVTVSTGGWVVAQKDYGVRYIPVSGEGSDLLVTFNYEKIVRYENRLFMINFRRLTELTITNIGKPVVSTGQTWGIMANSTEWFNGVGFQDTMGAMFLILPFGEKACSHLRIKELDGLRPIAATAGNRFVAMVCLDKSGDYRKIEITFDRDYRTYSLWQAQVDMAELNISILPKGVCATINNDGELYIFVPSNKNINKIQCKGITTEMKLTNIGNTVCALLGGKLYSVSMK